MFSEHVDRNGQNANADSADRGSILGVTLNLKGKFRGRCASNINSYRTKNDNAWNRNLTIILSVENSISSMNYFPEKVE